MSPVVPDQQFLYPRCGLRTRLVQEKIAAVVLRDKGYEPSLPVQRARRCRSNREVTTELPLFPGYHFCRFDHSQRGSTITFPLEVSIVRSGDQPPPVPGSRAFTARGPTHPCHSRHFRNASRASWFEELEPGA
jgi:hypothetical protein